MKRGGAGRGGRAGQVGARRAGARRAGARRESTWARLPLNARAKPRPRRIACLLFMLNSGKKTLHFLASFKARLLDKGDTASMILLACSAETRLSTRKVFLAVRKAADESPRVLAFCVWPKAATTACGMVILYAGLPAGFAFLFVALTTSSVSL